MRVVLIVGTVAKLPLPDVCSRWYTGLLRGPKAIARFEVGVSVHSSVATITLIEEND